MSKPQYEVYEVVVGNIGCVYIGVSYDEAKKLYLEYQDQSQKHYGRAGGEDVTMMKNGEIFHAHIGELNNGP